jgi:peptidoglycan/xylan/chitin deacetylase (PgdA/CDA1 family)
VSRRILAAAALAALTACAGVEPGAPPAPIRFVLTFDDGPAASTARVLETLASNPVQPGIKSIFFVQTRLPQAGGGEAGRALMRRSHAEGHVLAVHTGTPHGHVSHMAMRQIELEQSLAQAKADIAAATGAAPRLVRPPYWSYDPDTLGAYERAGLAMLLTDLNARDGVVFGLNVVPARRALMRLQLQRMKHEWQAGRLPAVDGAVPVVATFHDVNEATAAGLAGHLRFLVEDARALGVELAQPPFYDRAGALERAALLRARRL